MNNVEPKHYTEMAISPLEYIKANGIDWNIGNVIKYVSRYKSKNGLEDLKKAQWYLNDIIADLEANEDNSKQSYMEFDGGVADELDKMAK